MSRAGRAALGTLAAAALAAALAGLSQVPFATGSEDAAQIRVSWRYAAARPSGACVATGEAEPSRLPVHMRNPDACVETLPPFELRIDVDGRTVVADRIRPGGARGDRPVYVVRELTVEPGCRHLALSFAPAEGALDPVRFSALVALAPGEVALVTLDRQTGEPTLIGRSCAAGDAP